MRGNGTGARPARAGARKTPPGDRRASARRPQVDLARYVPTVVSGFADRLRTSSVAFLRDNYGITRLEWRVLSYLVARPAAPSAYRIWNEINADKGAISRTVQSLAGKGLVRVRNEAGGRRRTRVQITAHGRRLQAATVDVILERQRALLHGVSRAEVDTLLALIRKLEANIAGMDAVVERARDDAGAGAGVPARPAAGQRARHDTRSRSKRVPARPGAG